MGNISRHPIGRWRNKYRLGAMIETGCWRGDGVLAALRAEYPLVHTIDIDPAAFERLEKRVRSHLGEAALERIVAHLGDSADVVPELLTEPQNDGRGRAHRAAAGLDGPVLWWLDAHFPEQYSEEDGTRHPLLAEIEAITGAGRKRDVIVADDIRIYGAIGTAGGLPARSDGAAGTRRVPLHAAPREDLQRIVDLLEPTHRVTFDRRDGVYLVAFPKE